MLIWNGMFYVLCELAYKGSLRDVILGASGVARL